MANELSAALATIKTYNISGRKGTVVFFTEIPPSPTLTYRALRDLGIIKEMGHLICFKTSDISIIPIDSIKRASLDVAGIIKKALNKDWKIEKGSLVKEDAEGKEFKELLSS